MQHKAIVVFDLYVTNTSPSGQDILGMLSGLYEDYDFTVFSDGFDDPSSGKITWLRVPLPAKPIFLRFMVFQWLAPLYYQRYLQNQKKPWLVISTDGEFVDCDICWAHFCYQAYLKNQWPTSKIRGLRRVARSINYRFLSVMQAKALKRAKKIVVPSQGLANEIAETYPEFVRDKMTVIANPVEIKDFARPDRFDSSNVREKFGFEPGDIVMAFAALGDFGRKGLDLLFNVLAGLQNPRAKLLIVGGSPSEIREYEQKKSRLGLSKNVIFAGFQKDVRPYLWSSDLFVFPSAYETFSRIVFEASAAGLPFIATKVHGVEDLLVDGINGWVVEREVESITRGLQQALKEPEKLKKMGENAQKMVQDYGVDSCVSRWRSLLEKLEQEEV